MLVCGCPRWVEELAELEEARLPDGPARCFGEDFGEERVDCRLLQVAPATGRSRLAQEVRDFAAEVCWVLPRQVRSPVPSVV